MRDRLVQFLFRVWSPVYDNPVFQKPFYRRVHRAVLEAIGPAEIGAALDLGCGTAQLTADLRARWPGARVVGVDLSHEMLVAGRERLGAAAPALARADAYALPVATGSIDLLTSTISYHFYREPRRALGEIRRVVRPGGRFVLATLRSRLFSGDVPADFAACGFTVESTRRVRPAVAVYIGR